MNVQKDFPLSEVLWYRIGGAAKYFIEVENKEDVLQALDFLKQNNITKYHIIGLGSNILFPDEYFDGAVIQLKRQEGTKQIRLTNENYVESFAGELLDDVIQFGFQNKMSGLEWAGGLPGTVGGGVRGNVGAFGGEIKDIFARCEIAKISPFGHEIVHMNPSDMDFAYRSSTVKKDKSLIILNVHFNLERDGGKVDEAKKAYLQNAEYRRVNHPLEYPSCGSTFKNIRDSEQVDKIVQIYPDVLENVNTKWHGKVAMGYLINRLGFAGYQVGQAQVSPKHCNFILNLGGAKASDVIAIIQAIILKFNQTFGFSPEVEVEII